MIHEKLAEIQQKLKAPKGRWSDYGGYYSRSCEDILEAVKPLLSPCTLTITDDIVMLGDRYYVKATAILRSSDGSIQTSALAREAPGKTKFDDAQVTGSASSYARKYALNGLFCIDDTKDADATNKGEQEPSKPKESPEIEKRTYILNQIRDMVSKSEKASKEKEEIYNNILGEEFGVTKAGELINSKLEDFYKLYKEKLGE